MYPFHETIIPVELNPLEEEKRKETAGNFLPPDLLCYFIQHLTVIYLNLGMYGVAHIQNDYYYIKPCIV